MISPHFPVAFKPRWGYYPWWIIMANCRFCHEQVPPPELFLHYREKHPEEYAQMMERANAKRKGKKYQHRAKKEQQLDLPPLGDGSQGDTEGTKRDGSAAALKETAGGALRVQFVQRTIQVDARVLLFFNLARQRFPNYSATEGEWLLDVVSRYCVEHAEDFGLDMTTLVREVRGELEAV